MSQGCFVLLSPVAHRPAHSSALLSLYDSASEELRVAAIGALESIVTAVPVETVSPRPLSQTPIRHAPLRASTCAWLRALSASFSFARLIAAQLAERVPFIRSVLRELIFNRITGRKRAPELAGFNTKKGLAPLLPVFLHGLMHGSAEEREQAALALG